MNRRALVSLVTLLLLIGVVAAQSRKPAGTNHNGNAFRFNKVREGVYHAVGTGSLRGMPTLHRLNEAGFAVWPFTPPSRATVIEIYPRALTGAVNKSEGPARNQYLRTNYPTLAPQFLAAAGASEDAFDALVSALVMWERRDELAALPEGDAAARIEGSIWRPRRGSP